MTLTRFVADGCSAALLGVVDELPGRHVLRDGGVLGGLELGLAGVRARLRRFVQAALRVCRIRLA